MQVTQQNLNSVSQNLEMLNNPEEKYTQLKLHQLFTWSEQSEMPDQCEVPEGMDSLLHPCPSHSTLQHGVLFQDAGKEGGKKMGIYCQESHIQGVYHAGQRMVRVERSHQGYGHWAMWIGVDEIWIDEGEPSKFTLIDAS